jgi:pyridinium-3,5-bisthiocarboxylic acid mononucleotide nickel chelatase
MKLLYFDALAGASGDMTVGALLSLGLPLERLEAQLRLLPLTGYTIAAEPRRVHGISAIKFHVHVTAHAHHAHRAFRDIRAMLEGSTLDPIVKRHALAIFAKLAEAEAHVHAVAPDDVEFHEVGAVDSIVDIVGAAVGIAALGVERVYVSALPLGSGIVQSQHGPLPVPGPATLELLRGFPTRPGDGEGELVTPTGAAIIATLAAPEPAPEMRVQAVGYGAGTRTLRDRPNLLRLVLAEAVVTPAHDALIVIETNIDDLNPEIYDYVIDRLLAAGARDVYLTPVQMKKNRPGVVLSVLCAESDRDRLAGLVLNETSAIGLRYYPVQRLVLSRHTKEVQTPYGVVRLKVAVSPDGHENLAPEYEDCKRVAQEKQVPIKLVYQAALAAALR